MEIRTTDKVRGKPLTRYTYVDNRDLDMYAIYMYIYGCVDLSCAPSRIRALCVCARVLLVYEPSVNI